MSAVATSYLHDFVSPCQGRTFYTIRQRTAIMYKIPLRLSARPLLVTLTYKHAT